VIVSWADSRWQTKIGDLNCLLRFRMQNRLTDCRCAEGSVSQHMSNPAQNYALSPAILKVSEIYADLDRSVRLTRRNNPVVLGRKMKKVSRMEPIQGPLRNRLRRRLASLAALFAKFRATLAPEAEQVRSQRMCPFCGLITPRAKRHCLECGKPLRALQVEPKDVRQG
jgi:hypothetical protein